MKALTRLALLLLGSTRAQLTLIVIAAAALLLTACGPSDMEALQDVALDLQDAQAQALLSSQARSK